MECVIATMNQGKQAEFGRLLQPLGWRLRGLQDFAAPDVAETGATFIENALLKARSACAASGLPALADDSGLVVPALAGEPGIYSARYAARNGAGEAGDDSANNQWLLQRLQNHDATQRQAYFYCCLVWLRHAHDPAPLVALGEWHGQILRQPRGAGGFGYDPLFVANGDEHSAAELPPAEKSRRSHRGQALAALLSQLRSSPSG
ncbi:MAG: XTP/dITP diphosphatase [Wenzhouxiangellaceae bacterium]